ncbi:MAG TPA: AraC family transcriptional regulator [Victivallales bacterium]|nr:AraC family transcriptional regulator [Victivallales bacterium]HRR06725.1 AraC family transcriptional regulator [Victivallales bacterium]HRR29196.1 AraC family transcriptional regulator [Victivallales bacterium]
MIKRLKIIFVGEVSVNSYWHLPSHSHNFNEIIVILEGVMNVFLGGKSYIAKEGEILFYRKGIFHEEACDPSKPFHSMYLCFEGTGISRSIPDIIFDADGRIRQIIYWIAENRKKSSHGFQVMDRLLMASIFEEIERLRKQKSQENHLIVSARNFMMQNFLKDLTLEEISDYIKISKYHFCRLYKDKTGHTPIEELRLIRVNHAKKLILFSRKPLKEIAADSGFKDIFHMSRTFRKVLGRTPGSFRNIKAKIL